MLGPDEVLINVKRDTRERLKKKADSQDKSYDSMINYLIDLEETI